MRAAIAFGLLWVIVILVAVAEPHIFRPQASSGPSRVEVRYSFRVTTVTLNEPVVLWFSVHNGLSRPITLTLGAQSRQYFRFTLKTPDGKVFQSRPFSEVSVIIMGTGKRELLPGEDYEQPLLMSQWFPFGMLGTYFITSELTTPIEVLEGENLPPLVQTTRLLVNPRDPARLDKICADLAIQTAIAKGVEAGREPALELSYVVDPVAVPYLAGSLSRHILNYNLAVQGLERIGNDEAVEVLLSALNEDYGDIAELATASLGQMQDGIPNPRLKLAVKKAVERSSERIKEKFVKMQMAYLDYRSPDLQRAAIQNLMAVQDGLQRAEPVLQRLANDPNQPADVRAAARDALQKLHPPQR